MNTAFFQGERYWLGEQPGFESWEVACRRLSARVWHEIEDHSARLCQAPVLSTSPSSVAFFARYWGCLSQHWRKWISKSGKDCHADEMISRLAEGRGDAGALGGDPLADAVLCEALLQRDEFATEAFFEEYRGPIKSTILDRAPYLSAEAEELTDDYLLSVLGYAGKPMAHTYVELGTARPTKGIAVQEQIVSRSIWVDALLKSSLRNTHQRDRGTLRDSIARHLDACLAIDRSSADDAWATESQRMITYFVTPRPALLNYHGGASLRRFLLNDTLSRFLWKAHYGGDRESRMYRQFDHFGDGAGEQFVDSQEAFPLTAYCREILTGTFRKVLKLITRVSTSSEQSTAQRDLTALLLHVVEGRPQVEIASIIRRNVGNVSRGIGRATALLQQALGQAIETHEDVETCIEQLAAGDVVPVLSEAVDYAIKELEEMTDE